MSEHGRLIDGDELLELLWRERVDTRERIASIVERMPTIEPERKPGKWIDIDCPNCGCKIHIDPSAREERMKKRIETHACDCISRQAAIDVNDVRKIVEKYLDADDCNGSDVAMDILSDINGLSSAQQENDWTPVSKKKHPDKEGEYLVTDDAGGMATVDEDGFMFLDDGTPCWRYSQNVTAWRELPEPYKEGREE